jgi:hypothetical protein
VLGPPVGEADDLDAGRLTVADRAGDGRDPVDSLGAARGALEVEAVVVGRRPQRARPGSSRDRRTRPASGRSATRSC